MRLCYVVLLFTLSLFTTSESKIDGKSETNFNSHRFWSWRAVDQDSIVSSRPIPCCGHSIPPNDSPNAKKGDKGNKIVKPSTIPPALTIEVRKVYVLHTAARSHTTSSTTYKTVFLPSNFPIGEEYEYLEPSAETKNDTSPETTLQKQLNAKKENNTTASSATVTTLATEPNALVNKELMNTERSRRYVRNPYDFNLRYMLYPMNPDFFLAMEQSRQAESEVRNQQYLKKSDTLRSRRKINYFSQPNLRRRNRFESHLSNPGNLIINKPFL